MDIKTERVKLQDKSGAYSIARGRKPLPNPRIFQGAPGRAFCMSREPK